MAAYQNFLQQAPRREAAEFFELDDRSSKMKDFIQNLTKIKSLEGPKIPLPTEIDPKAKEKHEWVKNNMEIVFPNILSK